MTRRPLLAAAIALAMSWSAGFVDAACYERLHGTYTSHITGSTAAAGRGLAGHSGSDDGLFGWAIGSFVTGLLTGASLRHAERREGIRSAFAAVLATEIVLLVLFIACARSRGFPLPILTFFAAAAMGMQTATLTRVGRIRLYTTFHTASLSKFAESATTFLFWFWDRTRGRYRKRILPALRAAGHQESLVQAALTFGVWLSFLGGAVAGSAAAARWGEATLLCAIAPLLWAIEEDWRCPAELGDRPSFTDLE